LGKITTLKTKTTEQRKQQIDPSLIKDSKLSLMNIFNTINKEEA